MTENNKTGENVSVPAEACTRKARTETSKEPEFKRFRTKEKFVNHDNDSAKINSVKTIVSSEDFVVAVNYFDSCLQ
ncbi:MAG: hypothetical protein ACRC2T_02765 [Thermoguttaceae bacterium]